MLTGRMSETHPAILLVEGINHDDDDDRRILEICIFTSLKLYLQICTDNTIQSYSFKNSDVWVFFSYLVCQIHY